MTLAGDQMPVGQVKGRTFFLLVVWSELLTVFTHCYVENESLGEALRHSLLGLIVVLAVALIFLLLRRPGAQK